MKTPFDVAKEIISSKKPWNEEIQSAWNTFMVNRILSMNPDNIEFINEIQFYFKIPEKNLYDFYCEFLPQSRFHPYVKSESGLTKKIAEYQKAFDCSKSLARDYLSILRTEVISGIINESSEKDFTITKIKGSGSKRNK